MDNGYGLVNVSNQPKEPLYSSYLNATSSASLVSGMNGVLPLAGTFSTSAGIHTAPTTSAVGTVPLPVAP
jgi:hypothetical protein